MRALKRGFEKIIDFLFPTTCLVCGEGDLLICKNCFNKIPKKIKFDNRILSIYSYRDEVVNELIWKLKYHHSGDIAKMFGKVLAAAIEKTDFQNIVLVPIPLNDGDKRMHNHAELIARSIQENLKLKNIHALMVPLLAKNSKMKQAKTTGKKERYKNMAGSISLVRKNLDEIPPLVTLVLVDDVSTTGATIQEARNVLSNELHIPESDIQAIVVAH